MERLKAAGRVPYSLYLSPFHSKMGENYMSSGSDESPKVCSERTDRLENQLNEHLKESIPIRDMVKAHEIKVTALEKTIESMGNLKVTIIVASLGIILTVILAALTLSKDWGVLTEKVRRLESIDKYQSSYKKVPVDVTID